MPVEIKSLNGKLNLDNSPYRLPSADFTDALNITRNNSQIVHNLTGNVLIDNPYLHDTGVNKEIGRHEDVTRNRIYYFVWNSDLYHLICYYDAGTNIIVKVLANLTDTGDVDILEFDPSYKINHIDIIYRDLEGDLIMWCAGNSTPKCANVVKLINGDYGVVKKAFIEQAKKPTLSPPLCTYGTDTTINANSLKKALFQFTSRPVFVDFQKASFSTYSKIPLPVGYYGSDNDIDNTKNNFITIIVETGDKDVAKIEIAMRYNIESNWSDFILIASLDKSQLGIPDNSTYQFLFYNNGVYPPIDITEILPLFYYVPQLAGGQVLANGTVPVYGDITEGYNNYPVNDLQVTLTAENVENVPPDTSPPNITYLVTGNDFTFTFSGSIPTGTRYLITMNVPPNPGPLNGDGVLSDYTSLPGDITSDIVAGMHNPNAGFYITATSGVSFTVNMPTGTTVTGVTVTPGPPTVGNISTEKTWLWDCNYIFGLVYVDEQNRDMPGVTTYSNPAISDTDFLVTTPSFSFTSPNIETPVITATINHLPPAGARKYYWVRRRMTYGPFIMYLTCDYQAGGDNLYFCLANIDRYKENNTQFIYSTAPITTQSRIKIIAGAALGVYDGDVYNQDYEILGTETRTLTGGVSPADDRLFIKVKAPIGSISPAYTVNMVVMVYTPVLNPVNAEDSVYFEWGEAYDIYTLYTLMYSAASGAFTPGEVVTGGTSGATAYVVEDDGVDTMGLRLISGTFEDGETITGGTSTETATVDSITSTGINYHAGKSQDQSSTQEAEFVWDEGDVYVHQRDMYGTLLPDGITTLDIMDANFSDFYHSAVNDNGRAQIQDVNAKQQRNPALVRFGGTFESGTNINNINKFEYLNFDEYDRSYGIIRKMFIDGRRMFVFQQFNTGVVPVLQQIIKDTSGNPLQANSDILLNKIAYPYHSKHGIGDTPESFAYSDGRIYFMDSNLGIAMRISQNGAEELSVIYQCNNYFIDQLAAYGKGLDNGIAAAGEVYTGNPTVYGGFDNKENKYIIAFEEIKRYSDPSTLVFYQAPQTISFFETHGTMQGFESKYSFHPEGVTSLNNLLVIFKDGNIWVHNNTVTNNFFGVQYPSSITPVFTDKVVIRKKQLSVGYNSENNTKWACPQIFTNIINQATGLRQESSLIEKDFKLEETVFTAGLLRDRNSMANPVQALLEGDFLGGNYISVKFQLSTDNSDNLVSLIDPYLTDEISQRNF